MPALATLLLAIAAWLVVFLLAITATGRALGLPLAEIAFGYGPHWLRAGRLRLGVLPLGGYVRFTTPPEEALGWGAQLLLAVSGIVASLAVAVALLGGAGVVVFVDFLRNWLVGAFSPFGDAQVLLYAMRRPGPPLSFAALVGTVAANVAALNLLPLPGTNGWQLGAILGRRLALPPRWSDLLRRALTVSSLLLWGSWVVAVAVFCLAR